MKPITARLGEFEGASVYARPAGESQPEQAGVGRSRRFAAEPVNQRLDWLLTLKRRERGAPWRGSEARVYAVLLLILFLLLALFSKVFRSGSECGWTIGESTSFGQPHELCDWFAAR